MNPKEIFALDIGTRKVMGIIGRKNADMLEIMDVEIAEHPSRPMFDGQIHSIEEVSKTVKGIKRNLEARLNKKLDHVGVAVAGRNLITYRNKVNKEFSSIEDITPDMVKDLEFEALDRIIFDSGEDLSQFYCVGYAPVYYELDQDRISSLIGHRGRSIGVEMIVTFLPRVVLDSMFSVLKKSKLQATNITLEPISAINAIIPSEMRKLNIVLVDVGAGTSDIAITKDGSIFAFGMVPEAGDEITESISEHLLVDFSTAEKIKRMAAQEREIEFEDIWGRSRKIDPVSLKDMISPIVKKLSFSIAKVGKDLNAGLPQAVVAVGGGSQTIHLVEHLAESFGLSQDKIGIRPPSTIKCIKDNTGKLTGPEAVTPLGIALMTMNAQGLRFIDIEVNHKKFRLLDFQQKKDIMGALTLSGIINNKRIYPRPGMALTAEVNGELKIVKGTLGEPAKIILNGKSVSSLSVKIQEGDRIGFEEAKNGKDAVAFVRDLVNVNPIQVIFNKESVDVPPVIFMNDKDVSFDEAVFDRAVIKTRPPALKDILKIRGIAVESLSERQILVNINNIPKVLTQRNFSLIVNNTAGNLDSEIKENDIIDFIPEKPAFYRIKDIIEIPENSESIRVNVNDKDVEVAVEPVQIFMNGQQVKPDEFLIDGADIRVYPLKERKIMLSEIFRYIQIEPEDLTGKKITILVDDSPGGFTTPLNDGARVKILFEERGMSYEQ